MEDISGHGTAAASSTLAAEDLGVGYAECVLCDSARTFRLQLLTVGCFQQIRGRTYICEPTSPAIRATDERP